MSHSNLRAGPVVRHSYRLRGLGPSTKSVPTRANAAFSSPDSPPPRGSRLIYPTVGLSLVALLPLQTACAPEECTPPQAVPALYFEDVNGVDLLEETSRAGGIDVRDVRGLSSLGYRIGFRVEDSAGGREGGALRLRVIDGELYAPDADGALPERFYVIDYRRSGRTYQDTLFVQPATIDEDCGLAFRVESARYGGAAVAAFGPLDEGEFASYIVTLR